MDLHTVLKNGYKKNKAKNLNGFVLDEQLSNHNNQIYYNPREKKLMFNINGTNSASDWITNLKLATGIGFKESNRYKESHKKLRQAKEKYGVSNATVTGHSQAGLTANYISSKGDKVITLDKATTFGGKSQKGSENYRTSGDLVSLLNNGRTNNINLKNENQSTGNSLLDILKAHDVDNIKNKNILI